MKQLDVEGIHIRGVEAPDEKRPCECLFVATDKQIHGERLLRGYEDYINSFFKIVLPNQPI